MKKSVISRLVAMGLAISTGFAPWSALASKPTTRAPFVSQAPPNEPMLPFGDQRDWIVLEPIEYVIGDTNDRVVVPAGFVTDLASIPQGLWSFGLTPTGQYGRAAIIHDYLYWTQKCTRDQADRLLVIAMKESDVGRFDEYAIYKGVQLGGASSWRADKEEKDRGLVRTLAAEWRHPSDPNQNWADYRTFIMRQGATEQTHPDDGSYCRYGNSTEVPRGSAAKWSD